MSGILITGTDTGVGKTYVGCLLARVLRQQGHAVGVMKPCETGLNLQGLQEGRGASLERFPPQSDAGLLAEAAQSQAPPSDVLPLAFSLAAAPAVAAAEAGMEVDLSELFEAYCRISAGHHPVLVEGAGGLLVPLVGDWTWADLAAEWDLPILIVARSALGTLNHVALTEEVARKRGLNVLGIVVNDSDRPTTDDEESNLGLLEDFVRAPILARVSHGGGLSPSETDRCVAAVMKQISSSSALGGSGG